MEYDRGDSFPFDTEKWNSVWFKILSLHDHIPFNLKGNGNLYL